MKQFIAIGMAALTLAACTKNENQTDIANLQNEILNDFATNVSQSVYNDLAGKTAELYTATITFKNSPTQANLEACRSLWKDARSAWEKSEGFLFGPVSTESIDPRIDTWPVNFADLDSVLASNATIDDNYVNGLEDALRGFHPLEYMLWGTNGTKQPADFTARQFDYLIALASNVKALTADLAGRWNPANSNNYTTAFTTAGNGSQVYATKRAAFEELVNSMAGICDEVANGKIYEPFIAQDPSLEESPFAQNSITDFTNNIRSVEIAYKSHYTADGKGLEDFVRAYNLSLDNTIKTQIATAIAALQNITAPFGNAISTQPQQVEAAMTAINNLKETLEGQLLPLVQLHTN